jgi:hypothetical protein
VAVNLTRKTIVAAQTEATYGTDSTPATNTNTQADGYTQLVYGDGAGVYQTDTTMIDMPSLQATLSPQSQIAGRSLSNVSLQACLCQQTTTSGAATAIPYFDPLLMACGMDSDATAPGSAFVQTYTPTSTMGESGSTVRSATIVAYQGGAVGASAIETRATGVYMNADFNLTAGQAPTIQFTGQGKYVAPAHIASVPATSYLADTKVLVESEALTIQKNSAIDTPTGNTLTPICRSISFSTGNSIIERGDVNSPEGLKGLQIISRAPTLNLVIEAEDKLNGGAYGAGEATGDFYAGLKANTLHKVTFTHGSGVANVDTTFTFDNAQLTSVNMSDDGGIRVYNLAFALIGGAAGDNEYSIAFSTEGVS